MYICYGYVLDSYPFICTTVLYTYDSNSFEFDCWYKMFEFVLRIKVFFVLVVAGRMPRRCAATGTLWYFPDFIDENHLRNSFTFSHHI